MFTFLGKSVAKRPLVYVILWCVLLVLGFTAALSGFGQGNLFQRIESSSSLVPGSESDIVAKKTSSEESGEKITAIIQGVSLQESKNALLELNQQIAEIENVAQVLDPIKIDEKFKAELAKEEEKALQETINNAQPQITAAITQTLAAQKTQLQLLPSSLREQTEAQIKAKVRAEITAQITAKVKSEFAAKTADLKNPAADFMPENDGNAATGYAMLVELAPGIHPAAHAAVVSSFQQYQQVLRAHGMKYAVVEIVSKTVIQDVILQQVAADLIHGEIAGLPIALLLMILVFGGILAAGLPLAGALTAIGIAMGLIWSITFVTNVDSFVLNILSITGLALSIDYGLLVVSRYREIIQGKLGQIAFTPAELKQRKTQIMPLIRDAVSETVLTAGRTVSFSAITIAVSIAGLFLIKAPMIQIIGTGGVLVTLFAVLTAVTLVPACIVLLGIRLLQPSPLSRIPGISFLFRHLGDASEKRGIFSALAAWVHARPWRVLIAVTAILMISAMPIKDLRMRSNFVEYVPQDTPVAAAMEEIKTHYPLFQTPDITIYAETTSANTSDLIAEIQEMDHVQRVSEPNNFDSGVNISIYTDAADAVGKEVTDLVHQIRALDLGFPVYVGGSAAMQLDFTQAIIAGAPAAAIVIISAVFVLLFLLTGSLIVPLKALLINTLSLVSSTGIALFIFENGLFGMPVSHGLETFVVACAAAFGFGLAMDYEVFLIARIKEYWDLGMSNDAAVERGLQQSGRIITAAAAIIIAVFIGFSLGELMPVKQIGVVLAVIVFVDATLVRMLLVPSLMTLMGKWNWWAPKPLLKFYEKFKLVH